MSLARSPAGPNWTRWVSTAVSIGLLCLVFRSVSVGQCVQALGQTRLEWFTFGLLLYAVAVIVGALRWHLALSLSNRQVHFGASFHSYVLGCLKLIQGCGVARSHWIQTTAYARAYWFPEKRVSAASNLERDLRALGYAILVVPALLLALWVGGIKRGLEESIAESPMQAWSITTLAVIGGLGFVLFFASRRHGFRAGRLPRVFKRWVMQPHLGLKALVLAVLPPLFLSGVFAFNLHAVSHQPLPWIWLLWTSFAITLVSAFPWSVAGAGVRELAAVTILGWHQVPASEAVAAAVLTLAIRLFWSAALGGMLWRQRLRQSQVPMRPVPKSISVVIPAFNEESSLPETLRHLQAIPEVSEIMVVDGGSQDGTCAVAAGLGCRVLRGATGRGSQLRLGAAQAKGDVVLLLHADTWLPRNAGRAVLRCLRDASVVGGGFWKKFQDSPWLLWGSRFKCAVRLWCYRRVAGDQALFVRRTVLEEIGGVPAQPLMEEFALCKRLRTKGSLALASATLSTSARRFTKSGVLRTCLLMALIHLRYRLGASPEKLRQTYDPR